MVIADSTDVLVQVTDRTRGTRFTRHLDVASPDLTSAEWIVEAPSQCSDSGFCPQLPLTRFRSLAFTNTYATGNKVGGDDLEPELDRRPSLQLVPRSYRAFGDRNDQASRAGGAGAAVSALTPDGTGFTVNWLANPSRGTARASRASRGRAAAACLRPWVRSVERGGCSQATTAGFLVVPTSVCFFPAACSCPDCAWQVCARSALVAVRAGA